MFRWLFLFLLLANAILLFWHSMQIEPQMSKEAGKASGLKTLKLVSEMDPKLIGLRVKTEECFYFEGFESDVQAAAVTQFIVGLGGQADYEVSNNEPDSYTLIIKLPENLERRLMLMDYLETNELTEISDELLDFEFKLEGYKLKKEAIEQIEELKKIGVKSRLESVVTGDKHYIVELRVPVDQNLFSKIKEIVNENYYFIKIEKKLCKGVAKP